MTNTAKTAIIVSMALISIAIKANGFGVEANLPVSNNTSITSQILTNSLTNPSSLLTNNNSKNSPISDSVNNNSINDSNLSFSLPESIQVQQPTALQQASSALIQNPALVTSQPSTTTATPAAGSTNKLLVNPASVVTNPAVVAGPTTIQTNRIPPLAASTVVRPPAAAINQNTATTSPLGTGLTTTAGGGSAATVIGPQITSPGLSVAATPVANPAIGVVATPQPPDEPIFGATEVSQQAFANTVRNLMPLSPEQIKTLHYLFDLSQRAAAASPGDKPPRPTSSAVIVNLSPGASPPVIRLRAGFVSSLVFVDSTGAPWPIQAYDLGNPKSFNIQWDQKSNTLLVQATDTYQNGNLAVLLKDYNTPVMLTLIPGQDEVDYRVDLRVPGLGPNAEPIVAGLPETANPMLLDFLNGITPPGSRLVQVLGAPNQAWIFGNRLYLRTRFSILSPGWIATMSSPDGTHVFELPITPIILASMHGKIIQLKVEGL